MSIQVRPAQTKDISTIRKIIDEYVNTGRLLHKETVTLYESVQEFFVAVDDKDNVIGCAALHVLWKDLAEVRTVAVDENARGKNAGHKLMEAVIKRARDVGVGKIFCLTFETQFFAKFGFKKIEGTPVDPQVYNELLRSYDQGIAEFLDLEDVKPNTLGNTRMLLVL